MEFEYVASAYDELIRLAQYISSFKSQEMEVVFAQLLKKHINPPMVLKENINQQQPRI